MMASSGSLQDMLHDRSVARAKELAAANPGMSFAPGHAGVAYNGPATGHAGIVKYNSDTNSYMSGTKGSGAGTGSGGSSGGGFTAFPPSSGGSSGGGTGPSFQQAPQGPGTGPVSSSNQVTNFNPGPFGGLQGQLQAGASSGMTAGQKVLETAFDPQKALYDRTAQQLQDQMRVGQAARGITMSPLGAGIENQGMSNFNIDWQNNQLARQSQGINSYVNSMAPATSLYKIGGQTSSQVNVNPPDSGQNKPGIIFGGAMAPGGYYDQMANNGGPAYGYGGSMTVGGNTPGNWMNPNVNGGGSSAPVVPMGPSSQPSQGPMDSVQQFAQTPPNWLQYKGSPVGNYYTNNDMSSTAYQPGGTPNYASGPQQAPAMSPVVNQQGRNYATMTNQQPGADYSMYYHPSMGVSSEQYSSLMDMYK